jgi:hypothetical protein
LALQVRDLPFGVDDLFFGVSDLLIAFCYFAPEVLNLSPQPLILSLQIFWAGLVRVPMAISDWPLLPFAASPFRTHPPYINRSGAICPAKSTRVPELLPL